MNLAEKLKLVTELKQKTYLGTGEILKMVNDSAGSLDELKETFAAYDNKLVLQRLINDRVYHVLSHRRNYLKKIIPVLTSHEAFAGILTDDSAKTSSEVCEAENLYERLRRTAIEACQKPAKDPSLEWYTPAERELHKNIICSERSYILGIIEHERAKTELDKY